MIIHYADVTIPNNDGNSFHVRAFWDKQNGHGVDVVIVGPGQIYQEMEPKYVGDRQTALILLTTEVRRITRSVYGPC